MFEGIVKVMEYLINIFRLTISNPYELSFPFFYVILIIFFQLYHLINITFVFKYNTLIKLL
jgi:hypothetical protein